MEVFGHIRWQLFVYPAFGIVLLSLLVYLAYSILSRRRSLQALHEEGFLALDEGEDK